MDALDVSRDCNMNAFPDLLDILYMLTPDCNTNLVPDSCDIASGTSRDCNSNGVPDECEGPPCLADVNCDGAINVNDLLLVINAWGPCMPPMPCPGDVTGDGQVNVNDLLAVINGWGPCPQAPSKPRQVNKSKSQQRPN